MSWSRQGSGRRTSYNSSSTDPYEGHYLKMDPTLASTSQAVMSPTGQRAGVVKRVGGQFAGSWDDYGTRYTTPHAAVRGLVAHSSDDS
jgi:hypothetical protein